MNDGAGWTARYGELAASGAVEAREDGEWLAELSAMHYELRRSGKVLLVHLWSDERNLTRRVVNVKETNQPAGRFRGATFWTHQAWPARISPHRFATQRRGA